MRRSHGLIVISVVLALLSAGCYRVRPVSVSDLPQRPRVRLQASDGFRFAPIDSSGVMAAEGCTARDLTARLTGSSPDTLVLADIDVTWSDGGSDTCLAAVSAVVVPSENRTLRIDVFEATPRRAFAYGLLAGPATIIALMTILLFLGE